MTANVPQATATHTGHPADANIDTRELEQFSALADKWWDTTGPFRMLHRIGPPRLRYIREAAIRHFSLEASARRPLVGLDCLDVGCGGGLVAEPLTRLGGNVTAIDPARKNIEAARLHADAAGLEIDYRASMAEHLAEETLTFDLVTCLEVIEHVPDQRAFVQTLSSLVRPGGLIVLSTISRTPKSYALAIVGAEYILGWLPRGTHDWTRFVTPPELQTLCNDAGFENFSARGLVYSLLRDSWQLSDDVDVNYMAAATRPAGAES